MKPVLLKIVCILAGFLTLALMAGSIVRGDLNQDEGWYLYGARLVAEGQTPYVDFATTQGPVMPYVYALGHPLVSAMGVAGGRLYTALIALVCIILSVILARRMVPAPPESRHAAAVLTLCLLGINVFQAYYFSIVKTYALAGLLLVAGFLVLSRIPASPRVSALVAGVLIMLAAGTRASAAFALPAVFVVMISHTLQNRSDGRPPLIWLWFFAGATLTAALLFIPFALAAPESLWFAMVEYHTGREPGSLLQGIAYKGGFVARCIQDYSVAALMLVLLLIASPPWRKRDDARPSFPLLRMVWASVALISFVHFMAPFPYDDYQVIVYPLFCVALSCSVVRALAIYNGKTLRIVVLGVFLSCIAMASSSPVLHAWFLGKRHIIFWPLKAQAPLAVLQDTARLIEERWLTDEDPGTQLLLTQDPYLAVETGMALPPGFELGQFCYFPDWSREKAEACHVLNAEMFREALAGSGAALAAFSDYGLAIRCPEVQAIEAAESSELWGIVEQGYVQDHSIEPFGQADTRLRLLIRR